MPSIRVEAVIVRSDREGEADRLLTLFTRELGRVLAIARGVDRPKSRWAGRTRLFARVRTDLYQKRRGSGRYSFTQSQLLDAHERIQSSLAGIRAAARVCETVASLTPLEEPQPETWDLLTAALDALEGGADGSAVAAAFQLRFLRAAGFGLHLDGCAVCNRPYPGKGPAYVSAKRGGLVCRKCLDDDDAPKLLTADQMRLLLSLDRKTFEESAAIRPKDGVRDSIESVIEDHIRYHLDHESKTARWLKRRS